MNNINKLFGITALFDTPNEIILAAKKTADAGFKNYDANIPYPVHGLDRAMKLKPSKMGFVTLTFGLSGTVFILLFMFWSMSISYPLVIGGKPFFALPAFVPITFEFTVLLAAISTVLGMIMAFFNLPQNNHPLHDTQYLKSVSIDKFGIVIEASDAQFTEESATEFLKSIGGKNIEAVYYPETETYKIFEPKFLGFLAVVAILVSTLTYFTLNKLMYKIPFNWMSVQDKTNPQQESKFFIDKFGMRMPVAGTVARGFVPYPYMGQATEAEPLSNPLLATKKVLELGQKKYLTFCSPCHGNFAAGKSRLREQFPNPPSLLTARAIGFTDGHIYHVITNGQNIMPSYSYQITREERWAIVNYVRVLQRAQNATESDITEVKKEAAKDAQN